jgi:hypothetical protein
MFKSLNIHFKGGLFFFATFICFGLALYLYQINFSDVYHLSSERNLGAVTFMGLAGTFGSGFLLAFYFGYLAVFIERFRINRFVKTVMKANKKILKSVSLDEP